MRHDRWPNATESKHTHLKANATFWELFELNIRRRWADEPGDRPPIEKRNTTRTKARDIAHNMH